MPFIEFPLRLTNGFLRRVDEAEAILALVRVMAATPSGSWPGCRSFGIRDLLEEATRRRIDLEVGVHRVNEVLQDLGITAYRLESIRLEEGSKSEAGMFTAILLSDAIGSSSWSTRIQTA